MEEITSRLFDPTASPVRYIIHQGGTRSGKTYTIVYYLLLYARRHRNTSISIVSESLPHLKRGVIRDIKQIIAAEEWEVIYTENKTDHLFSLGNGSFIECFGADTDSKLRGAKRDILFINECNNVSYPAFEELDVRTTVKTIVDFNPVNRFWVHDELMTMLENSNYVFIKSTYKDNPYLSHAEIHNIERRRANARWWRIYGEGETGVYDGNVFTDWDIIGGEHTDSPLPGKMLGYGIDFGFVHSPTAVVQVNEFEGDYYVKELFYNTGTRNDELWNYIKDKIDIYAQAVADCSEPKTIADLRAKGWTGLRESVKGPDSVKFGLNLLLERKIYITNDSLNLIKEFRNYIWDRDKNGKNLDVPIKEYDHGIDAMRYVVSYPKKKVLCIA